MNTYDRAAEKNDHECDGYSGRADNPDEPNEENHSKDVLNAREINTRKRSEVGLLEIQKRERELDLSPAESRIALADSFTGSTERPTDRPTDRPNDRLISTDLALIIPTKVRRVDRTKSSSKASNGKHEIDFAWERAIISYDFRSDLSLRVSV